MSIRAIDWAFNQTCGHPTTKFVLMKLADNANDHGECWPSMRYIADHCEISRTTVWRCIDALVQLELIEAVPRFYNGMKQSNMYRLKMPIKPDVSNCNNDVSSRVKKRNEIKLPDVSNCNIEPSVRESKRQLMPLEMMNRWIKENKKANKD